MKKKREPEWRKHASPEELQDVAFCEGKVQSFRAAARHYSSLKRKVITRCRLRARRSA
jgi:hypothetical protein